MADIREGRSEGPINEDPQIEPQSSPRRDSWSDHNYYGKQDGRFTWLRKKEGFDEEDARHAYNDLLEEGDKELRALNPGMARSLYANAKSLAEQYLTPAEVKGAADQIFTGLYVEGIQAPYPTGRNTPQIIGTGWPYPMGNLDYAREQAPDAERKLLAERAILEHYFMEFAPDDTRHLLEARELIKRLAPDDASVTRLRAYAIERFNESVRRMYEPQIIRAEQMMENGEIDHAKKEAMDAISNIDGWAGLDHFPDLLDRARIIYAPLPENPWHLQAARQAFTDDDWEITRGSMSTYKPERYHQEVLAISDARRTKIRNRQTGMLINLSDTTTSHDSIATVEYHQGLGGSCTIYSSGVLDLAYNVTIRDKQALATLTDAIGTIYRAIGEQMNSSHDSRIWPPLGGSLVPHMISKRRSLAIDKTGAHFGYSLQFRDIADFQNFAASLTEEFDAWEKNETHYPFKN